MSFEDVHREIERRRLELDRSYRDRREERRRELADAVRSIDGRKNKSLQIKWEDWREWLEANIKTQSYEQMADAMSLSTGRPIDPSHINKMLVSMGIRRAG